MTHVFIVGSKGIPRNCVEQFIGSPRAKSIFSGGVSNGSQRENQNPSAEL